MKMIKLHDLRVGKVDAKHEWLADLREGTDFISDSFVMPDNIDPEDFACGKAYFVTGLKGTGKTALLRYIAAYINKKADRHTAFILFKSEVAEEDRKEFSRLSGISLVDESKDVSEERDYEIIWRWYFYRKIAEHLDLKTRAAFADDKATRRFVAAVRAPYLHEPSSAFQRFMPRIKKGRFSISAGAKILAAETGVDFEWDDADQTHVKFAALVNTADHLFEQLNPGLAWFHIFVDELELAYGSRKQFDRDCRLVRDLIITIERLNSRAIVRRHPMRLVCAVRSEVLAAVSSLGKEINKITTDYGIPLFWHRSTQDFTMQPLLNIIVKKLEASERLILGNALEGSVWQRYFPLNMHEQDTRAFLLHSSWYRPRDFVRLMSIAQRQDPNSTHFTQSILDDARKTYSIENWTEMEEELQPAYSAEDIDGIQRIFTGFKAYFTYEELDAHVRHKCKQYNSVKTLSDKRELSQIIEDLFRIGMVGNRYHEYKHGERRLRHRWAFREDNQILLEKGIAVHNALHPVFSLG